MNIQNLSDEVQKLSYSEKQAFYQRTFSVGYIGGIKLNERLVLISLIAFAYKKLKEKDATTTPLKILLKITGPIETSSAFYQTLESLSILVEDFLYGVEEVDSCGLKNAKEITTKIKELLETWLPF
jgi:hypothetical protein